MKIFIRPFDDETKIMYENHGHFHPGDAGLDLYVMDSLTFEPGETNAIHLHISCESKDGKAYYLLPRSSISKTPLRMANSIGLIDGGYRGELIAVCDNIKGYSYTVEKGQRLFQIVGADSSAIEFELKDQLSATSRGLGGFGSTGS